MSMVRDITIQIPLFNETDALRFSKFYFESIGEKVHYVMDRQCTAETRAIVRQLSIEEFYFENDKPFIENGYEAFAAASPTDWILRIDCDELPTPDALMFARYASIPDQAVGAFERYQVLWSGGKFIIPLHERFAPSHQRQFRLFNRRHVVFDRNIHTPGICIDQAVDAPAGASLYHLSWIFLSWNDRLAKADRYDAHGQPEQNRANQLFSLDYEGWHPAPDNIVAQQYAEWLARRKN